MFTHIDIPELPKIIQKNRPNGKRTYITPEGNEYPSVTTILGGKEKPHLDKWRIMMSDNKKVDKEAKRCADREAAVREMVEKYLNNEPNHIKGYKPVHVDDFNKLRFALNKIDNIRAQKAVLYSDMFKYAGAVDCVAEFQGVLSIIGFGSSTVNQPVEVIGEIFKQLTAYSIAWFERTGIAIEDMVVLISVERGLAPLIYKDKIENWIPLLLEDLDKFNK